MEKYNVATKEVDFHFVYPSPNDIMLAKLKQVAGIEVDSISSELDNIKKIIGYAHSLFTHNGDNTPTSSDPLTILEEARAGQSFRCVEYSSLAAGLLWANGIPARTVGLKTSDVETREYGAGHVVIEFWSNEFSKWAMCDVQAGIIPQQENTPLSAFELIQRIDENDLVEYVPVNGSRFSGKGTYDDKPNYSEWIREYLYFVDTPVHLTLGNEDKRKQQIAMLVPLGVEPPKMFQGMFEMNAVYTHSVLDFYTQP
ncbi:MAG: transglutaminase protein [Candidatus Saccharibacteria bacterium]|nr:transglutaminase protein [Candidatus Saccharibacteria bacterium]